MDQILIFRHYLANFFHIKFQTKSVKHFMGYMKTSIHDPT
jgi:hypothetical protein